MTHLKSAANITSPLGRSNHGPVGGGVITALVESAWHQLGQFLAFFLADYVAVPPPVRKPVSSAITANRARAPPRQSGARVPL
jgi:hypothetical protein